MSDLTEIERRLLDRAASLPGGERVDLSLEDLTAWTGASSVDEGGDLIARALAEGFHHGRLDYQLCDDAANSLFCLFAELGDWPALFWAVYLAFDAGEYYHSATMDDDPVQERTAPMIAQIVARLQRLGDDWRDHWEAWSPALPEIPARA